MAQHYADSAQRLVFAIIEVVWYWSMEHYIGPITLPLLHTYCTQTDTLLHNT